MSPENIGLNLSEKICLYRRQTARKSFKIVNLIQNLQLRADSSLIYGKKVQQTIGLLLPSRNKSVYFTLSLFVAESPTNRSLSDKIRKDFISLNSADEARRKHAEDVDSALRSQGVLLIFPGQRIGGRHIFNDEFAAF